MGEPPAGRRGEQQPVDRPGCRGGGLLEDVPGLGGRAQRRPQRAESLQQSPQKQQPARPLRPFEEGDGLGGAPPAASSAKSRSGMRNGAWRGSLGMRDLRSGSGSRAPAVCEAPWPPAVGDWRAIRPGRSPRSPSDAAACAQYLPEQPGGGSQRRDTVQGGQGQPRQVGKIRLPDVGTRSGGMLTDGGSGVAQSGRLVQGAPPSRTMARDARCLCPFPSWPFQPGSKTVRSRHSIISDHADASSRPRTPLTQRPVRP